MIRLLLTIILVIISMCIGFDKDPIIVKEPPVVLSATKFEYTDREVYLMACLIYSEGRGESYYDNICTGSVVLNRINSDEFPNTLEGVIYQPGAFDGVLTPSFYNHYEKEVWAQAQNAAYDVLRNGPISKKILFYLNPKISDRGWLYRLKSRCKVIIKNKNHHYYGKCTV